LAVCRNDWLFPFQDSAESELILLDRGQKRKEPYLSQVILKWSVANALQRAALVSLS